MALKPIDAMEKANTLGASEPSKKCSLFIAHAKFFNITKDPVSATLLKSLEVHLVWVQLLSFYQQWLALQKQNETKTWNAKTEDMCICMWKA